MRDSFSGPDIRSRLQLFINIFNDLPHVFISFPSTIIYINQNFLLKYVTNFLVFHLLFYISTLIFTCASISSVKRSSFPGSLSHSTNTLRCCHTFRSKDSEGLHIQLACLKTLLSLPDNFWDDLRLYHGNT